MTALALQNMGSASFLDAVTFRTLAAFSKTAAQNFAKNRAAALERRRIADELEMCTDRELLDMGFSRCDIPAIAAGTYQR